MQILLVSFLKAAGAFPAVMGKTMKRPAATPGTGSQKKAKAQDEKKDETQTLQGQIATWQKGVTAAAFVDEDSKRDKGKGEKFTKMKARGELEPHILAMYERPPPGTSARTYRSSIINRLFNRQPDGALALNYQDAFFTQAKQVYEERYQKHEQECCTKLVFIGRFFSNSEPAFEAALAAGEIVEHEAEDGTKLYGFRKVIKGSARGSKDTYDLNMKSKIKNGKDVKAMVDLFNELKWQYKFTENDKKKLEDGTIPPSATKLLSQALQAQEKLCKLSLHMITKDAPHLGSDAVKDLKQAYATGQKHITEIQHILNFSEFADGQINSAKLDKFLYAVAQDTQKHNQEVYKCQGLIKANRQ